jgi:hypothetical protein
VEEKRECDKRAFLKVSRIFLIATVAALLIGIALSLYFNSLFIFVFLPFGFGWGFTRKDSEKRRPEQQQKDRAVRESSDRSS